ncbi:MAG: hypothetical protein J5511_00290 [Bacilli bacterium]|nr:hypothetical protein [Bacilli bacterium]
MANKKEILFFTLLALIVGLFAVGSIAAFIYAAYDANEKGIVFGVTFELVYMGLFFVVQFFAILMSIKAVQNGSFIFSELTHIRNNAKIRSKPAAIIALVFAVINLALFVYALLVVLPVNVPMFNFPLALFLAVLPTSITILTIAIFFYIYPFIFLQKGE